MTTNGKPTPPKVDAMARELKETLAERRPRRWRPVLVTSVVAILFVAVVGYWIWYPRAPQTSLVVLAFDDVVTPEQTARTRAQLLALLPEQGKRRVRGEPLVFVEPARPGARARETPATTDAQGRAGIEWTIAPPVAEFQVRHIAPLGNVDRGTIYVWAKDTPILVVDADETLIADQLDPNAAAALTKAYAEEWRTIYVAFAGTNGHDFRKARDWIGKQAKLPRGPVLGRPNYPNTDEIGPLRREVLKTLQNRFTGPLVAIVKSAGAARIAHDMRVRTVRLDNATTWADVPAALK